MSHHLLASKRIMARCRLLLEIVARVKTQGHSTSIQPTPTLPKLVAKRSVLPLHFVEILFKHFTSGYKL